MYNVHCTYMYNVHCTLYILYLKMSITNYSVCRVRRLRWGIVRCRRIVGFVGYIRGASLVQWSGMANTYAEYRYRY